MFLLVLTSWHPHCQGVFVLSGSGLTLLLLIFLCGVLSKGSGMTAKRSWGVSLETHVSWGNLLISSEPLLFRSHPAGEFIANHLLI